ncbi:probable disease resistance protein At5g63020 [Punica granatum]|uniref:Probable disease resistance protein At5g63020 n=1 Tax=Punica granatum TaxID=22663 RepID=A0A6P8BYA0_PUNGR|nr:probable disease resistance protein At5g63020 [Punica granatum]
MVEQPLEPPVGLDSSFEEVSTWVQDEGVRRIGLYDMGGVGKTTLLKKIHNEFLVKEHDYHVVAWIVVSQPTDPKKIQEHIWEKLHLPKSQWNDIIESERPGKILKIIKEKNFLIFLDDVWEEIDLLNLGIPSRNHQHKSKIIFTTRLQDVCGSMHAERTKKVECLPADKALKLFREKVGEQTWTAHVEIPNLAEAMIKECKYLPLALITVGAAMASRRCPDEWRGSIEVLKKLPSEFADMEKKVLSVLEFSYEALLDETHKKCFLYCSIFPEDHVYRMDELIDLWIGEGLLSECGGIREARDQGIEIARCLIRVCLSEEVDMSIEKCCKMHDVVRDMALWVASEHGKKKRPLCQEKQRSFEPTEFVKWTDVERISLWEVDQKLEKLPDTFATFSSLSTLIIRDTKVKTFPNGFFSAMLSLRVLDVSCNEFLIELPGDIGVLGNLRYLDLQWTMIRELPAELENLTKLMGGEERKVIEKPNHCCNTKLIQEVCLRLDFTVAVEELLMKCPHLQRCLRELRLRWCKVWMSLIIPKPSLRTMEHLKYLQVSRCEFTEITMGKEEYGWHGETGRSDGLGSLRLPSYPEISPEISHLESQDCFRRLERIIIEDCDKLREVTVLIYHAPCLTYLRISCCESLRELIAGDVEDSHVGKILSSLIYLDLGALPELESICRGALSLPSLELLQVVKCRQLKKLPLKSSSSAHARRQFCKIRGDWEWWNGLQWDDPETKRLFFRNFISGF